MDHSAHEPGTVPDCPECRTFAYEPGWYKSLRAEHAPPSPPPIVIPEAEEPIEVVLPEVQSIEVVLPDLEDVRPEDDER